MNARIALVAAVSALALAVPVAQAAPGDNIARLKVINISPDVDSDVPGLDVDDATTAEIGLTHFLTGNWAVDFGISYAKHDVTLGGGNAGSAKLVPVNLIAQYHFMPEGQWRPYVGAGVNYTHFDKVDIAGGTVGLEKDRFGPVIQAGLDVPVSNTAWSFNADVKKVWLSTDASGAASGNVDLDPWIFGVGVGYKF
ncbi:MAG TPA: OmpW family outer membrane protein [Burkholderiales bacterium]|nr:OmpW family outer membrane protein [Burkholderiales bacterium]